MPVSQNLLFWDVGFGLGKVAGYNYFMNAFRSIFSATRLTKRSHVIRGTHLRIYETFDATTPNIYSSIFAVPRSEVYIHSLE